MAPRALLLLLLGGALACCAFPGKWICAPRGYSAAVAGQRMLRQGRPGRGGAGGGLLAAQQASGVFGSSPAANSPFPVSLSPPFVSLSLSLSGSRLQPPPPRSSLRSGGARWPGDGRSTGPRPPWRRSCPRLHGSAGGDPSQSPLPRQVSGLRGGSVSLPLNASSAERVSAIEWTFQARSGHARLIAEFRDGQWELFNSSFGGRLETAEKTALRISGLRAEDGGEFKAHVKLTTASPTLQIEEHAFRLTVYEPVPEPQIALEQTSGTPDGCNVTLRCLAFGQGELNVSWEAGYPPRTLEGGSDWYQLSANGSELHVSWRPSLTHANVTCLASNPADRKRASFDLRSVCPSKGGSQSRRKWYSLVVPCVAAVFLAAALGIWLLKRRRKPRK